MPITLLANDDARDTLRRVGQPGGITPAVRDDLMKKIDQIGATPKLEGKGKGLFGIDLKDGNRALFMLNEKKDPVLVYVGNHDGYDKIWKANEGAPEKTRARYLGQDVGETSITSKKLSIDIDSSSFGNRFREAIKNLPTKYLGTAGRAASFAGAAMMAADGASAAEIARKNIPGYELGEGGKLCEAFAEAGSVVAGGLSGTAVAVSTTPVITPVGGAAAGIATGIAVEETTKAALNAACKLVP